MNRCVTGLELPDWFGRNWDALADSLTDLSWWGETSGYLLMTAGWPGFEQADPKAAATAVNVFTAAVGYWAVREPRSPCCWAEPGAGERSRPWAEAVTASCAAPDLRQPLVDEGRPVGLVVVGQIHLERRGTSRCPR